MNFVNYSKPLQLGNITRSQRCNMANHYVNYEYSLPSPSSKYYFSMLNSRCQIFKSPKLSLIFLFQLPCEICQRWVGLFECFLRKDPPEILQLQEAHQKADSGWGVGLESFFSKRWFLIQPARVEARCAGSIDECGEFWRRDFSVGGCGHWYSAGN